MIRVVVDDLAFLQVDAVLRPANATLDPVTAATSRLDEQAGQGFTRDRQVQLPLDVGAAVVTGAGELAAQFVVHVVIQSAERNVARDTVRKALVSAWQRASDWRLASIATPLVGAGVGALSLEDAASLLAETFHARGGTAEFPAQLSIVVDREEDRALVEAILNRGAV